MNWQEPEEDEWTLYSGKTKSFEYPNNKSANDQSVSHNPNELKNIPLKNVNNIIIAQININSIRNKFELLSHYVSGNIDIIITNNNIVNIVIFTYNNGHKTW